MIDNAPEDDEQQNPTQITELSPAFKCPGETVGDRLIAASMFIDLAIGTIEQFPDFPKDDLIIGECLQELRRTKGTLLFRLGIYPAGSAVQE